tara:strand:- start:239 stop:826 length:588 start_codon:yes stop_codon:yes gene_type:complete
MPVTISGSGITGIPAGGYPDQSVTADDLATTIKFGETLQTKYIIKTDTASYTNGTWADVAGLSVDITPTSTSHKIFIQANLALNSSQNHSFARIVKEISGTTSTLTDLTSTSMGSNTVDTHFANIYSNSSGANDYCYENNIFLGVHEPGTIDPITFKVQFQMRSGYTAWLNASPNSGDTNSNGRSISTIIVQEIK